ncbi:hypothetical protein [Eubacterium sp.]
MQNLVPKLYLRNFALNDKSIYVKQKVSGKIFKVNIKKIAIVELNKME